MYLSWLLLFYHTHITVSQYECTETNTYVQLPSLPHNVGEVSSSIIGNNLYLVGQVNEETYKYSLIDHTWSTVADRLYKGNHHGSLVINNEWWLIGGLDDNSYNKIQIYNPESNQWRENTPLPWNSGSPCVALINGIIYVCGGVTGFKTPKGKPIPQGKTTVDTCAKFDTKSGANSEWQMIQSIPYGRNHAAVTADNQQRMWIFGGRKGKNAIGNGFDTVQVFDTLNEIWTTSEDEQSNIKRMPFARGGMGNAIFYEGKMYIFGGETLDNPKGFANENMTYDIVDIYDIESNEWNEWQAINMLYARHGIFPVLYKDAVYIAGGGKHNGYSSSNMFTKYCLKADNVDVENRWIQIGEIGASGSDDGYGPAVLMYVVLLIMVVTSLVIYRKWNRKRNKIKLHIDRKLENMPFLPESDV